MPMTPANAIARAARTMREHDDAQAALPSPLLRPDPLHWRLIYRDGAVLDEPPSGWSIARAPHGAAELQVVTHNGVPICRVDLPDGMRPVWYRRRYTDMRGTRPLPADLAAGYAGLEATVFGRVRGAVTMTGAEAIASGTFTADMDAHLWAAHAGRIVNCPPHLFDGTMILTQYHGLPAQP